MKNSITSINELIHRVKIENDHILTTDFNLIQVIQNNSDSITTS